jgi:hypothetical protein
MGSQNHSTSDALIRRRIKNVILKQHRERFGIDAKVVLEPTGYRNHLDLWVVSPKFARIPWDKGISMVWEWIENEISVKDWRRIMGTLTFSPAEARRLFGRAV